MKTRMVTRTVTTTQVVARFLDRMTEEVCEKTVEIPYTKNQKDLLKAVSAAYPDYLLISVRDFVDDVKKYEMPESLFIATAREYMASK